MTWKERLTTPRIIALVLLSLVPLGAVALGLQEIANGILITPAFLFGFFLLKGGSHNGRKNASRKSVAG